MSIPPRIALLILLLTLPACASHAQIDSEKSQSIQASTDALATSTPRARSIILTTGADNDSDNRGTLDVYGDLRSPTRLQLTFTLLSTKTVIDYYFLDKVLARATIQRLYAVPPANSNQFNTKPAAYLDMFFENQRIVNRKSSANPDQTADLTNIQQKFVTPDFVQQLLKGTRATGIDFDFVSDPPRPPIYFAD